MWTLNPITGVLIEEEKRYKSDTHKRMPWEDTDTLREDGARDQRDTSISQGCQRLLAIPEARRRNCKRDSLLQP